VAVPPDSGAGAEPRTVDPSLKVTVPVGVPDDPVTLADFKCLIVAVEAMCSAAWNPEVHSYKF
jgi:hypothetical protein